MTPDKPVRRYRPYAIKKHQFIIDVEINGFRKDAEMAIRFCFDKQKFSNCTFTVNSRPITRPLKKQRSKKP